MNSLCSDVMGLEFPIILLRSQFVGDRAHRSSYRWHMFKRYLLAFTVFTITTSSSYAWGPNGHRVTGKIAQSHLTPEAQAEVTALLGVESLAEASTWPDFMRSNPSDFWRKGASPWHYITVPPGTTYEDTPPEGDAMSALAMFSKQIADDSLTTAERQLALRFAIHLIGDLHQPLHVGRGDDRGGNNVDLLFKDEPTNLHALWDEDLIEDEKLSYTEKARWLDRRITANEIAVWSDTDPNTWIEESLVLRDRIYEELGPYDRDTMPNLSYDYVYKNRADIDLRLQQSGIRIAAYLNTLFSE